MGRDHTWPSPSEYLKYKEIRMKQIISTVNGWVTEINNFLQGLIVLGVAIGILFNDYFGVIGGIGNLMGQVGENGLAGLVALILVVLWYKK